MLSFGGGKKTFSTEDHLLKFVEPIDKNEQSEQCLYSALAVLNANFGHRFDGPSKIIDKIKIINKEKGI